VLLFPEIVLVQLSTLLVVLLVVLFVVLFSTLLSMLFVVVMVVSFPMRTCCYTSECYPQTQGLSQKLRSQG
jgi:hypothetical protein